MNLKITSVILAVLFSQIITPNTSASKRALDEEEAPPAKKIHVGIDQEAPIPTSILNLPPEDLRAIGLSVTDILDRLAFSQTYRIACNLITYDFDFKAFKMRRADPQPGTFTKQEVRNLFFALAKRGVIRSCKNAYFGDFLNKDGTYDYLRNIHDPSSFFTALQACPIKHLEFSAGFDYLHKLRLDTVMSDDSSDESANEADIKTLAKTANVDISGPLEHFLKTNTSLQTLVAWGDTLNNPRLMWAIATSSYLKQLSISNSCFNDIGMTSLCLGLQSNTVLKSLALDGNDFTSSSAPAISLMLCSNTTLTELSINARDTSGKVLDDQAIPELCKALKTNTTLKRLDLAHHFFIHTKSVPILVEALNHNTTLQQLSLDGNFSKKSKKLFLESRAQASNQLEILFQDSWPKFYNY
jgi:hypothetical protein